MFRETPVMIKQSDLKLQWKRQERNENMKIKHLALVLAGVLLLTGCGSGQAAGTAEDDSSAKTNQTVDEANKGMGRYVEAETDLSDICRSAAGLRLTKDGTLYLCDAPGAVYESTDQGENWNPYELPSLEEVVDQSPIYFISMDMAEDGSEFYIMVDSSQTTFGLIQTDSNNLEDSLDAIAEEVFGSN